MNVENPVPIPGVARGTSRIPSAWRILATVSAGLRPLAASHPSKCWAGYASSLTSTSMNSERSRAAFGWLRMGARNE